MCEYCNKEEKEIINTRTEMSSKDIFYPGIIVWIEDGVLQVESCGDTYEPNFEEAETKINYCPMCGRKLGEDG